jgi:hypothetical protein
MKRLLWATLALTPVACGDATDDITPDSTPEARIQTLDEGGGVFASQVDATDDTAWVYLDLDTGEEVAVDDLATATDWDLGFRRSNIKVNGGWSGPADVRVAVLPGVAFDDFDAAPVALFEQDAPSSGEVDPDRPSFIDDDGTDFVFTRANAASTNGWYDYDPVQHVLSPADVTFVVRSTEGEHFKLRFLDYYNEAGTSGVPTFRWAPVAPPPGPRTFTVDASGRGAFVYVNLEDGAVVDVADPAASDAWDLAFQRTLARTNGGASGPGWGGARDEDDAFEAIDFTDTIGFVADTLVPPPGPPVPEDQWVAANASLSAWFDYDPVNHTVSPRDATFIVRGAGGESHKLRILGWEDGVFALESQAVPPKPDIRTLTVDASGDAWTYVSLRRAEVVEPEAPEADLAWDLALRGEALRLNGGSSGPGDAAAIAVDVATLGDVLRAPDTGYAVDAGGANPVLDATGVGAAFVVRLADGTYAKLRPVSLEDGAWTFELAYAGPGRRSFR